MPNFHMRKSMAIQLILSGTFLNFHPHSLQHVSKTSQWCKLCLFIYGMKYYFMALGCLFTFEDQMPKERAPYTLRCGRSQTSAITTNTNQRILTLSVPFSNPYQLGKSPCAAVWFLKPSSFWFQSKYPKSVFTRLDAGDFFRGTAAVPHLRFETATIDECRQSLCKNSEGLLLIW